MADFNQAIKWVREGKEIRRKSWEGKSLKGYKPNYSEWRYSMEDFEATDWEIYCDEHEWEMRYIKNDKLGVDGIFYCKNCRMKKPEEELKTLEDLEGTSQYNDNPPIKTGGVDVISLKKEAIKDIRYYQKLLDELPEYFKKYSHKNNEGKELPKETMEGVYRGKIEYIKWKFNITQENLE